jgi:hypothetical protein
MSVVVQINYAPDPVAQWSVERARDVALSLAGLPVMNWELWVQCETQGTWGGIYLFDTEADAHCWEKHAKAPLAGIGAISILTQRLFSDEAQGESMSPGPRSFALADQ